ncbi:MAG: hypothetical protein ACI9EW_000794 [Cellvibrionaceae bacterium]|jgi:hypothetical protein
MTALIFDLPQLVESNFIRYEFPPEGITTLGHVVRRMHKTVMLAEVEALLASGQYVDAMSRLSTYALAAAVSFGQLFYEPGKDHIGSSISEKDPDTGALVNATLMKGSPQEHYSYVVQMPDGSRFQGNECSNEQNYSMTGWMLPANVCYEYVSANETWMAKLNGQVFREIIPRLVGPWQIRATANLTMSDSTNLSGNAVLSSDAKITLNVKSPTESKQDIIQLP